MSATQHESVLLEGKVVAAEIRARLETAVQGIAKEDHVRLTLASVMVGDDSSAGWYFRTQEKTAKALGIEFEAVRLNATASQAEIESVVEKLSNERDDVHGIILTLPMPPAINVSAVLNKLNPRKDVEGILPENLGRIVLREEKLVPATALAAMMLIESTKINVRGALCVLVGQSAIVGRPLAMMLGSRRATVTVCNSGSSAEQMEALIGQADVVVGCCGQPGLIQGKWIKEGATVIDVGTTEVEGKLVGDVEFEAARKRAQFITPVPGGVGPLTTVLLMDNLLRAYQWQKESI